MSDREFLAALWRWNEGIRRAREAYDANPHSTHRQRDDYTRARVATAPVVAD